MTVIISHHRQRVAHGFSLPAAFYISGSVAELNQMEEPLSHDGTLGVTLKEADMTQA